MTYFLVLTLSFSKSSQPYSTLFQIQKRKVKPIPLSIEVDSEYTSASTVLPNMKTYTKEPDSDIYAASDSNCESETPTGRGYVGREAFTHYYKNYKKFSKDPKGCPESATIAFIKECKELNLNPAPLGLIKRRGEEGEIDANASQLGSTYLQALTKSLKHLDPKTIRIENVRENEDGIIGIVDNLKKGLVTLDFSNSTLTIKSVRKIIEWMETQATFGSLNLKNIVLHNCKITDNLGCIFIEGIRSATPDLIQLDLSQNKISDRC